MKTITRRLIIGAFVFFLAFAVHTVAQDAPQFSAIQITDEGALHVAWTSTNHEVYQIQCADALNGNDDGSTAWQVLYDDYPSQGTNTFWLDTGNYNLAPQILHPKNMPMRFYRIVDLASRHNFGRAKRGHHVAVE